jgi:hypothetical protein
MLSLGGPGGPKTGKIYRATWKPENVEVRQLKHCQLAQNGAYRVREGKIPVKL